MHFLHNRKRVRANPRLEKIMNDKQVAKLKSELDMLNRKRDHDKGAIEIIFRKIKELRDENKLNHKKFQLQKNKILQHMDNIQGYNQQICTLVHEHNYDLVESEYSIKETQSQTEYIFQLENSLEEFDAPPLQLLLLLVIFQILKC